MDLQALSKGIIEQGSHFCFLSLQVTLALDLKLLYLVLKIFYFTLLQRNSVLNLTTKPTLAYIFPFQVRELKVLLAAEVGVFVL